MGECVGLRERNGRVCRVEGGEWESVRLREGDGRVSG